MLEVLPEYAAAPANLDRQPERERVDDGGIDSVPGAGSRNEGAWAGAADVGKNRLQRRLVCGGEGLNGDAPAVVGDGYAAVIVHEEMYFAAVPGVVLLDRILDERRYHMERVVSILIPSQIIACVVPGFGQGDIVARIEQFGSCGPQQKERKGAVGRDGIRAAPFLLDKQIGSLQRLQMVVQLAGCAHMELFDQLGSGKWSGKHGFENIDSLLMPEGGQHLGRLLPVQIEQLPDRSLLRRPSAASFLSPIAAGVQDTPASSSSPG